MTNEALEKAIDKAGHDRVFMRAQSYGWMPGGGAPEWVWWGIVSELENGLPPPVRDTSGPFDFLGFSGSIWGWK